MSSEFATCLRIAARELRGQVKKNNAITAPCSGTQIAAMVLAVAALRSATARPGEPSGTLDVLAWAEHVKCIQASSGWTTCYATDRSPEIFNRQELREEVELVLSRTGDLNWYQS